MDVSSTGKRKSSVSHESGDSDGDGTSQKCPSAKISARDFASQPNSQARNSRRAPDAAQKNRNELKVLITGTNRPMKHWHPTVVTNGIHSLIGDYTDMRLLPSGDLIIACKEQNQVNLLLECSCISVSDIKIPVKTSLFQTKPYVSRAVISGVPLDITEYELLEGLSSKNITYIKRLKRKTDKGLEDSLSVLLCFNSKEIPETLSFSYLYFRTKPYNPRPKRCYRCNRFGHTREYCRGRACCSRCGGNDHEYNACNSERKCVNCHQAHSAAYGGCPVYKTEAQIQVIKERSDVSFTRAQAIFNSQSRVAPKSHPISSRTVQSQLSYSHAVQNQSGFRAPTPSVPTQKIASPVKVINRPAQNNGDLRYRQENQQPGPFPIHSNDSTSHISIGLTNPHPNLPTFNDPLQLLVLIAEIVKLTITAHQSGNDNIYNIVSQVFEKYYGYPAGDESTGNGITMSFQEKSHLTNTTSSTESDAQELNSRDH